MTSRLMTTWTEYDSALREILPFLSRTLRIFDEDLYRPNLEHPELAVTLQRFLKANRYASCEIILRDSQNFRNRSPRLMALLDIYSDRLRVFECAPHLLRLHDNFILVDDNYALIRIHKDHARSKVILDDKLECAPYIERFGEIRAECETQIHSTMLGL